MESLCRVGTLVLCSCPCVKCLWVPRRLRLHLFWLFGQLLVSIQMLMGVMGSSAARIPEVHGKSVPLHSYFTHPFLRGCSGQGTSPKAQQLRQGSQPGSFSFILPSSLVSASFLHPLSGHSLRRSVQSMLVYSIFWSLVPYSKLFLFRNDVIVDVENGKAAIKENFQN